MGRKFFFLTVFIVLVELLFIAQTRIEALMAVPAGSGSDMMAVFKNLVNPPPTPNGGWFYNTAENQVWVFNPGSDSSGTSWYSQ